MTAHDDVRESGNVIDQRGPGLMSGGAGGRASAACQRAFGLTGAHQREGLGGVLDVLEANTGALGGTIPELSSFT